jgi:hypothetical protein
MPRRVQHPSGSLQYARGSLCGRRGTPAAARDLVREMGSLENHGEATAGLQSNFGGLIKPKQSQISPPGENASGIPTNAAPISKPKPSAKPRRPALHFRPVFAARAHTRPSPPGEPARRSPAALRLRAAAHWGSRLGGKKPPAGLFEFPPERRPDPLIGPGAAPAPI